MKKEYLIKTLKLNIELLEKLDLPEDFTLYHTIDRGRSIDDPEKIVDFDLDFYYDKEDNELYLSYTGEEE
jgi:hypothetical protein